MNQLKTEKFMNLFNEMLAKKNADSLRKLLNESDKKGDDVDIVNAQKEEELSLRLGQRNLLFLKKVETAKNKILEGTYGDCEDCGDKISQARLIARPTACLCIGCQEEKEQAQFNNINYRRDLSAIKRDMTDTSDVIKKKNFSSINDIGFESVVDL